MLDLIAIGRFSYAASIALRRCAHACASLAVT